MIIMDSNAQLSVDIIAKVAQRKITIVNATKLLNKSRRTIERYLQKYQKAGIQFVIHQNSGKSPTNKISDALKRAVSRTGTDQRKILRCKSCASQSAS